MGGRSAMHLCGHKKIIVFAIGDESTYGRDFVSAIHSCRGCRDWGCFDASDGGHRTHHHILEPAPHPC
jgi:hypothetical protein